MTEAVGGLEGKVSGPFEMEVGGELEKSVGEALWTQGDVELEPLTEQRSSVLRSTRAISSLQTRAGRAIQQQSFPNRSNPIAEKIGTSQPHERLSETSVAVCLEGKVEPSYPSVGLAVEMAGEWAGQPACPGKALQLEVDLREMGGTSRACRQ